MGGGGEESRVLTGLPHLQEALRQEGGKEARGVTARHRAAAAAPSWAPGVALTRGKARRAAHSALPPCCREAVQHSPALPSTTGPARPPRPPALGPSPSTDSQRGLQAAPRAAPAPPGPAQPPSPPRRSRFRAVQPPGAARPRSSLCGRKR